MGYRKTLAWACINSLGSAIITMTLRFYCNLLFHSFLSFSHFSFKIISTLFPSLERSPGSWSRKVSSPPRKHAFCKFQIHRRRDDKGFILIQLKVYGEVFVDNAASGKMMMTDCLPILTYTQGYPLNARLELNSSLEFIVVFSNNSVLAETPSIFKVLSSVYT